MERTEWLKQLKSKLALKEALKRGSQSSTLAGCVDLTSQLPFLLFSSSPPPQLFLPAVCSCCRQFLEVAEVPESCDRPLL